MRTTSLVVLAILLGASSALSQQAGIMACGLRKSDCRDLIGKRLWVRVPDSNPNSVEFSEKPNDWKQTLKMKAGSFLVTDVIRNSTYGYDFFVELPDGKRGYVGITDWIFLTDTDPVESARKSAAAAKAAKEECDRRGQPKIGMTKEQVATTCLGQPEKVNRTITAAGTREQHIYPNKYLYFDNGVLVTIQETN